MHGPAASGDTLAVFSRGSRAFQTVTGHVRAMFWPTYSPTRMILVFIA